MAKHPTRRTGKERKNTKWKITTSAEKPKDDIFGFFKGKIEIKGDIVSPIIGPEEWGDLYPDDPEPKPDSSRRPRRRRLLICFLFPRESA
jgi:hypothetical protein